MIVPPKGIERYPALASFLDDWFHQDFDIYGETLEAIMQQYVKVTSPAERLPVIRDIARFQKEHGASDDELEMALNSIFEPEVMVEGWDGMTTREWLTHVAQLITESLQRRE